MKIPIVISLPLVVAGFTLLNLTTGCSQAERAGGKVTVAVSIPPQAELLRAIGGDSIEIATLLRADSNPETFEISVSDLKAVASADAYFKIGNLPFEQSLTSKIGDTAPSLVFYDNSDGIELISGTHAHHHDGDHSHAAADPHTWSSVKNLKVIADNMGKALAEIDPDNAEYYSRNLAGLQSRLDSIDTAMARKIAESSPGASFLIWHPSLSYFARDYGLHQITLGEENKDMSVKRLRENIQKASDADIKAIFIQKNFDPDQASNVAGELGIAPIAINPLASDWEAELNNIVNAITSK